MNIWTLIISCVVLVICVHCDNVNNQTNVEPNGLRFQRILHRKKRFLLFPPGSAVTVSDFFFVFFFHRQIYATNIF